MDYVFIFLTGNSNEHKCLMLMMSNLCLFFFIISPFCVLRELCLPQGHKDSLLCCFSRSFYTEVCGPLQTPFYPQCEVGMKVHVFPIKDPSSAQVQCGKDFSPLNCLDICGNSVDPIRVGQFLDFLFCSSICVSFWQCCLNRCNFIIILEIRQSLPPLFFVITVFPPGNPSSVSCSPRSHVGRRSGCPDLGRNPQKPSFGTHPLFLPPLSWLLQILFWYNAQHYV